jgi:DNA-binding CsgD family transcriptional regulator
VNGLINFAASREAARPDVRDAETLSRIVSAGIVGNSNMIRLIARALGNGAGGQRAARAVIVNVSSPSAWPGQVESAEYAAYTAGLLSMSLWIAREAAALGVRVITLASCPTHRPLVFQWPPEPGGDQSDRLRGLTRVEQPEEYASLVHQLVEGETAVTKGTQADGLSQREVEVLKLVAEGKTNKEIGALLGISARTVQVHTSNIYGKIRVGNRAAAALWLSKRDYELQSQSDRSLEVLLSGLSETRPFDRNRASRVVLSVTA